MGIDIWEAIEAAATKPFGFMPFWPGPGLGGHCIPVDPFYLAWRAQGVRHEHGVRGAGRPRQREHALLRGRRASRGPSTSRARPCAARTSCCWAWPTRRTSATCARALRSSSLELLRARRRGRRVPRPARGRTLQRAGARVGGAGRGAHRRGRLRGHRHRRTRRSTWRSSWSRRRLVVDLRNAVRQRLGGAPAGAVPANVDVL